MKLAVLAGAGALLLAGAAVAYARARKASGADAELAAVAAMLVVENGIRADAKAHQATAEVFWRNARAAQASPRQVLAGKGGALAPWPTSARYAPLLVGARAQLAVASSGTERLIYDAARAGRTSELVPGGTNWTHGAAPFAPWLEKGYTVVASYQVPSKKRPYLWIYRRPS